MAKIIAQTTDNTMLMVGIGADIPWNRPAVVEKTHLVGERIGTGKVEQLAEVPDCANDEDFLKTWEGTKDGANRVNLAVDSYVAELEKAEAEKAEAEKAPAKKAPAKKAPAKKAPAKPADTETE